ncbi:DNA-binding protein [Lutibacter sp. TH_r2]|uniref:DNA-binding protein n=1 Tax=Lutibacter sp. TH_r2 TaxID=3082083 RepID=UPI002955CC05|nr:DNA-binding protein [Lutibacter sp. TH_r2]MDV7187343.1 DNA-binding protein [Lutibacter sp. TH_r2]
MNLKVGDKVELLVVRHTDLGFTVLIDDEFEGMLYKNEMYQIVSEGERLTGYIKKIREDNKIDVSLQPIGFKQTIVGNELIILNALRKNDGFLALHDKSDPFEIKSQLEMSKKAFKSAIGGLYRQKLITLSNEGISLTEYVK